MALTFDSYLNQQQPQQNQYLTGNPSTDPNAQTTWMNENADWQKYQNDWTSGTNLNQSQPTTPPQNGTFLGSIAAGNVGQYMPQGYDQNKWNDPNKHDPKYDIGRILSKYPPNEQGLQAAGPELEKLGFRLAGKDKIVGPDGHPVDVGQGFSGAAEKGGMGNWWWNPSFVEGQQNGNAMQQQPNFLQMIMQLFGGGMQQQPQSAMPMPRQMERMSPYNPTGGVVAPSQMSPNTGITGGMNLGTQPFSYLNLPEQM